MAIDGKKNGTLKKWVSLSLAGAGVAGGSAAFADIITVDVNQTYNFGDTPITLDLPGINDMRVSSPSATFSRSVALAGATGATYFQVRRFTAGTFSGGTRKMLQPASAGQTFNSGAGTVGSFGLLGATDTTFGPIGTGPYASQFFLFRFADSTDGGQVNYGWLQASLLAVGSPSTVTVQIERYAYDTSGAPLTIPEPTTLGMGALMLGAMGIRRWRQAKRNAA